MTTIPTLSLWQPWAVLCVLPDHRLREPCERAGSHGYPPEKEFETRGWGTRYRGPLLIHAAKRFTEDERATCRTEPFRTALVAGGFTRLDEIPLGALLGLVYLQGVHRTERFADGTLEEKTRAFGDFSPRRYAWHIPVSFRLPEPVPYRGAQGLFEVPTDVLPATFVAEAERMRERAAGQSAARTPRLL